LDSHYVFYGQPHEIPIPGMFKGKTINFTMWETSHIPVSWPQFMNRYSEIWTPSQWGKDVIKASGVSQSIKVVPLGVDTTIFSPRSQRHRIGPFEFFIYVSSSWSDPRKKMDLIYRAFQAAFGDSNDVRLTIKVANGAPNILQNNVKVIYGALPIESIVSVLNQTDCFVFISSGEGFGQPPREAMAVGVPVILGSTSALRDVAISEYCTPVLPDRRAKPECGATYGNGNDLGEVDDYSLDSIVDAMRFVYNNYDSCLEKAVIAQEFISSTMTYNHTVGRIMELLNE